MPLIISRCSQSTHLNLLCCNIGIGANDKNKNKIRLSQLLVKIGAVDISGPEPTLLGFVFNAALLAIGRLNAELEPRDKREFYLEF